MSETFQIGNLTVRLIQDDQPFDPRTEQDNLGTMVCWHRRYKLGDEHNFDDPEDFRSGLIEEALTPDERARVGRIQEIIDRHEFRWFETDKRYLPLAHARPRVDRLEAEVERIHKEALGRYVILPVYLLDHSGLTMRTASFSDPWDSGQVGWIYMPLSVARENWSSLPEAATSLLRAEVEEYDHYLRGDVWGYTITDEHGDELYACWGFLGLKDARDAAEEAARYLAATLPAQLEMSL